VKNRILLMLLAVMLTLSAGLVGCGGQETPEIMEYTLTISSREGGSVTMPGEGIFAYDEGTNVDLVAAAADGYVFDEWIGDAGTITMLRTPPLRSPWTATIPSRLTSSREM
jgi:hypothetical protein